MRICEIIESSGGSVRAAIDLAKALVEQGDDVAFVYSPIRVEPFFVEEIRAIKGLHPFALPVRRALGWRDLVATVRLISFLAKTGPYDVLHAHSSKAGGIMRLAGLFFPSAAKIYTPHAFVTMSPSVSPFYALIEKGLSYLCDRIIAVSSLEKDHAVKHIGIDARLVEIVPNAVVTDVEAYTGCGNREQLRRELHLAEGEMVLGFVGRLDEQKNVRRLADVFAAAFARHEQVRLVVIGDGNERAAFEARLAQHGLTGKALLLGWQEARGYYTLFDALVCSSDYEGFPLVFLEALVCGVPIVTTPVGGAAEAVIDGKTGFIASACSDEALEEALEKFLVLTVGERERMSHESFVHSRVFSHKTTSQAVRAIYLRCLKEKSGDKTASTGEWKRLL
ncbi:MAG: glycosyltransferase [Alphaproteobacteria bacterium]|nr:glycosyltransferase [Alphaproteobacteria bacterium]